MAMLHAVPPTTCCPPHRRSTYIHKEEGNIAAGRKRPQLLRPPQPPSHNGADTDVPVPLRGFACHPCWMAGWQADFCPKSCPCARALMPEKDNPKQRRFRPPKTIHCPSATIKWLKPSRSRTELVGPLHLLTTDQTCSPTQPSRPTRLACGRGCPLSHNHDGKPM